MKLLTLIENKRNTKKLYCEHGLSFHIEHGKDKVLIDTGSTGKFARNASRLGADLTKLTAAVISHNHFDHTGGVETLLKLNPGLRIFAKKNIAGRFYIKKLGVKIPITGLSPVFIEKHRDCFVLFNHFQEICHGFYLMGCEVFYEKNTVSSDRFFVKRGNETQYSPDDFSHELFAVVFPKPEHKEHGCVVISSCSHNGIVNILETVRQTWNVPILGVVGGFHFMHTGEDDVGFLRHTAKELSRLSSGCVYTCHCTGDYAFGKLKEHMGDQLQTLNTGEELTW